jgi:hypothetical protein
MFQQRVCHLTKIIRIIGMGIVIAANMMMGEHNKIGIAGKGDFHRPPGFAVVPRAAQDDKRLWASGRQKGLSQ